MPQVVGPIIQYPVRENVSLYDPQQKEPCRGVYALIFAGSGQTDENGVWEIDLNKVYCQNLGNLPPGVVDSFTATPGFHGEKWDRMWPVPHLIEMVNGPIISVRSVEENWNPVPKVQFFWHLVFRGEFVQ